MENTGDKAYRQLEQYDPSTGQATGVTKVNHPNDPDYVPPTEDLGYCPLPTEPPEPDNQLDVNPNTYNAQFIDNFNIEVTSNGDWTINCNQSWVNLSTTSGGSTQLTSIDVYLQKNTTGNMRTGVVEFYMGGEYMEACFIYQQSEF